MRRSTQSMTRSVVLAGFALSFIWTGCDDEEAPGEIVDVAGEPVAIGDVEAEYGGNIVVAGNYPLEVVTHESGEIFAYVHGMDEPPPGAELTVEVPVVGRQTPRPLRLRWNEYEERYEGLLVRLEVEPGPLVVHYEVGGHVYDGRLATIIVAPAMEVVVEAEPQVRVVRRKHKHKHMRHKHMRRKHRGGAEIEIRF